MEIKIFGIRHHGPGSSKNLISALETMQPDVILIEGPEELTPLLPYVVDEELVPPIAALIYNPKNLKEAVYYPFTVYSPEWQTFLYGAKEQVPIIQMDLPQSLRLGLHQTPERLIEKKEEKEEVLSDLIRDPLGYLARLAGYQDSERWWEVMFEQGEKDLNVFEIILDLMRQLREEVGNQRQAFNLIREAYMRKIMRKTIKAGYQKIAIVCGAWHAPALENISRYKTKDDNALLKGIPKVKTKATWIPWTYGRIATSSGYGAGVLSPAWYDLLFHNRSDATINWMAQVSQLFKEEDLDTSSAHAIEAVRLAETLATLRGLELPGIEELTEAVVTIFSNGRSTPLDLITKRLVIGHKMGTVPSTIPIIPLQQDLETTIKSLKLQKYKKPEVLWLKATAAKPKGGLDLRQEHDLKQSQFLHRLNLLSINWGITEAASGKELSTKNEYWKMEWQPEFIIQIIEAGMWGNTVEQASVSYIIHKAKELDSLTPLTQLLEKVIHANLPEAVDHLVTELKNLAAITKDISHLMGTLPSLVYIHRYGDVRNTKISMISALIDEIVPRVCVALPLSSVALDEQASEEMFEHILAVNKALNLLDNEEHLLFWTETLERLADNKAVDGLLRGAATRILFDSEYWLLEEVAGAMTFALSKSVEISVANKWLQGFLYGSGLLLIHNPDLWKIVDTWINALPDESFQQMLPALRRTFAKFGSGERRKMLEVAKKGKIERPAIFQTEFDVDRAAHILPTLKMLLED